MDAYDQHSSRLVPQRTAKGTVSSCKSASTALSQNPPTLSEIRDTPITGDYGVSNAQNKINRDYRMNNIAIFFDTLDNLSLQLIVCVCVRAILLSGRALLVRYLTNYVYIASFCFLIFVFSNCTHFMDGS